MTIFLLLSLALRLSGLAAPDLWYDEWLSWYRASQSFTDYLANTYEYTGANLWEILLRAATFGPPWFIRLPALACALAALYFAHRLMVQWGYTPTQKAAASLALATLPGLIWMAQDARFYAAIGLLYLGSIYAAERGQAGWLGLCLALSIWIHPTAPAYLLPACALALLNRRIPFKMLFITGALAGLAWLPRVINIIQQNANLGQFWTESLNMNIFIYELGQALLVNTLGHAGILLAVALAGLVVLAALPGRANLQLMAFILPVAALVLVSLIGGTNIITYRTLQPAGLGLGLLAGPALFPLGRNLYRWAVTGLGLLTLLTGLASWDPSVRDGGLQQITAHIRHEWREGDTLVYVTKNAAPFSHYLGDLPSCQLSWPKENINLEPPDIPQLDRCALGQLSGRAWLVWPYSPMMSPALVAYLESVTAGQTSITRTTEAWQMAPLEIYLLEARP